MDSRPTGSRSTPPAASAVSPVVLRLLPHVHHPPASVLVLGSPEDAAALNARGYRVEVAGAEIPSGGFDLVCEAGRSTPAQSGAWFEAVARALRPGGQLFGAISGLTPSELIHRAAGAFEVLRVEVSPFSAGGEAVPPLEVVLVRR
jgi:hypothetical protein